MNAAAWLDEVRGRLLAEARRSPLLLADLAGLESYVAESYTTRSFVELLQNADDAGARRFVIERLGNRLVIANDGRQFTKSDFDSLCRSAASAKGRGETIGFRGIGFKSVVSIASSVYLLSGNLEAVFSRALTEQSVPAAARVPLVRIPHPVPSDDPVLVDEGLVRLRREGWNTIFVLDGLQRTAVDDEFRAFDPSTLLFLRSVVEVTLADGTMRVRHRAARTKNSTDEERVVLERHDGSQSWRMFRAGEVVVAFGESDEGIVPLDRDDAIVHVFLPTNESTGFPFKIDADFSTDPARTQVVMDGRTGDAIEAAAKLIVSLLERAIGDRDTGLMRALLPFSDPRLSGLRRRTFATEISAALPGAAGDAFRHRRLRPPWLNARDFERLAEKAGLATVPAEIQAIPGATPYLEYLGAAPTTLEDLVVGLNDGAPSAQGAAELVAYLVGSDRTSIGDAEALRLWVINGQAMALTDALTTGMKLDGSFVDMVTERSGCQRGLRRLLVGLAGDEVAAALLGHDDVPVPRAASAVRGDAARGRPGSGSVHRWRTAEQQVLAALRTQGWTLEDVSRQSLGYDLAGARPTGEPGYVEVKVVTNLGQPITLTTNEEATARIQGGAYFLAIVRETAEALEIGLISDPASTLPLTRTCRQWVWECDDYPFQPQQFRFFDA